MANSYTPCQRSLGYLYFLRFSILLWGSLPGLLVLNYLVPSLAHGLFALERPPHYFCAGFFVTFAGCVALLMARITCAYGEQRFGMAPPERFSVSGTMRLRTFILMQVPGLILLLWICCISIEEAGALEIAWDGGALLGGIAVALAFWGLVSVAFDCAFPDLGKPSACFLIPGVERLSSYLQGAKPPAFTQVFRTLFLLFAALGDGYADPKREPVEVRSRLGALIMRRKPEDEVRQLMPGHALNIVLALMSLLLYVGIFPFTAPTLLPHATLVVCGLFLFLALAWVGTFSLQEAKAKVERKAALLKHKDKEKGKPEAKQDAKQDKTATEPDYSFTARLAGYIIPVIFLAYLPASYMLVHDLPFKDVWARPIPVFPAIAPLIMILIIGAWILSALSFLLDRFHVPVVISIFVLLLFAHLMVGLGGAAHRSLGAYADTHPQHRWLANGLGIFLPEPKDHFVGFACAPEHGTNCPAPTKDGVTPAEVLHARAGFLPEGPSAENPPDAKQSSTKSPEVKPHPLIVVTATGGGIHAAAWTAGILADLEYSFGKSGENFHDSVILLSAVSGGSAGSVPFVRGYFDDATFGRMADADWMSLTPPSKPEGLWDGNTHDILLGPPPRDQWKSQPPPFVAAPETSSLEAVSWGLVYPDLFRTLLPTRTLFGLNLEKFDRGWAIQTRMDVNEKVEDCAADEPLKSADINQKPDPTEQRRRKPCLTLRQLEQAAKGGKVPAVSLNTTTAEHGGRFLLSNYQAVNEAKPCPYPAGFAPAESFLHDYGARQYNPKSGVEYYPDLEIISAARLSATFPYVSPMARVPRVYQDGKPNEIWANALHFADGGYYDNDGTGTAMEFLYEAFYKGDCEKPSPEKPDHATNGAEGKAEHDGKEARNPAPPVPILWIEIRDDDSFKEGVNPDDCRNQITWGACTNQADPSPKSTKTEAPLSQVAGPLSAFYNAGHASITLRNHREMEILKEAYKDRIRIKNQPFAFSGESEAPDPATGKPKPRPWHSILFGTQEAPLSWHLTGRQKVDLANQIHAKRCLAMNVAQWFADCKNGVKCDFKEDIPDTCRPNE